MNEFRKFVCATIASSAAVRKDSVVKKPNLQLQMQCYQKASLHTVDPSFMSSIEVSEGTN